MDQPYCEPDAEMRCTRICNLTYKQLNTLLNTVPHQKGRVPDRCGELCFRGQGWRAHWSHLDEMLYIQHTSTRQTKEGT